MKKSNVGMTILCGLLLALAPGCALKGDKNNEVNVVETDAGISVASANYKIIIEKEGFRYSFQKPDGTAIAGAHPVSGIRFTEPGGTELYDVVETTFESLDERRVQFSVVTTNRDEADVWIDLFDHHARFSIIPRTKQEPETGSSADESGERSARFVIDARTDSLDPVYGLGDFGSHADDFIDVDAPCGNNVAARDTANLIGLVRDEMTNQGSCRRFISNFVIFPAHGFAQVLFNDAKKRIGFTETENRLGVADVRKVSTLYYFTGSMEQIYRDYKTVRREEGYHDVKPRFTMFNVGWEAYGALGWDTYQTSVMENIETYLDKGFPLRWGVVGSGFWPGPRNSRTQGTTVSFGMWDDTATPRDDGLPNPRYPDPDELKELFRERNLKLILGLRNHFKAPDSPDYNQENDGPFPLEAYEKGYLLRDDQETLVRSENNQFPGGPLYFIDSYDEEAMEWYMQGTDLWQVDGFKEDAMIYDKMYHDAMWNPFNHSLAEQGYLIMVRNAAYSVPGDLIRINDSYAGTGEHYHADPHRMPLNLLNNAASGAANGYPDIIGGTPTTSPTTEVFRKYYVRNAILAALTPGMSFGRGPWVMEHPEYEAIALDAAMWHDRYAPYIYSAAIDTYNKGFPHTMTPLHIAFPDDENTYNLISREKKQYQWMLGPSMMATPLFGTDFETAVARDVYLPEGTWIDYETGISYTGPKTLNDFDLPVDKMPVFIGGKGVVVSRDQQNEERLNVTVYPIANGGSRYTYTYIDGETVSTVTNDNEGWNADTIMITDVTAGEAVEFDHDSVTGAFKFRLSPGHDYALSGGGE